MANNTWTNGNGTNVWNDALNWSLGHVPLATEDVIFDGTDVGNCTIDTYPNNVVSIAVDVLYTGQITQTCAVVVNGPFASAGKWDCNANFDCTNYTLTAGTFQAGAGNITTAGNVAMATGTFSRQTSTFILSATGTINAAGIIFHSFTQNNGVITDILSNVVFATGGILTTGNNTSTIRASGATRTLYIYSTLINNGCTWGGGGQLMILYILRQDMPGGNYGDCRIWFRDTLGVPRNLLGNLTTTERFYIDNWVVGTAQLSSAGFNITCAWLRLGQTTNNLCGKLILNPGTTLQVNGDLTIYADDGSSENALVVDTDGANLIYVSGNWDIQDPSAEFDAQQSTVIFNGVGAQTIKSSGNAFYDIQLNDGGAGGSWTLQDALTCHDLTQTDGILDTKNGVNNPITASGDIAFDGGTLIARGATITCPGSITFDASFTFTYGTSKILLNGTSTQTIMSNGIAVYDMEVTNTEGKIVFDDAVDIDNQLIANAATADILIEFDENGGHTIEDLSGLTGTSPHYVKLRSQVTGDESENFDVQDVTLPSTSVKPPQPGLPATSDPNNTLDADNPFVETGLELTRVSVGKARIRFYWLWGNLATKFRIYHNNGSGDVDWVTHAYEFNRVDGIIQSYTTLQLNVTSVVQTWKFGVRAVNSNNQTDTNTDEYEIDIEGLPPDLIEDIVLDTVL